MARPKHFIPHGVIPAALTIFNDDLSINVAQTRKHFQHMAGTPGVTALTLNGHAAEVHALTDDEQQQLLELGAESIGDNVSIVAGVYADGSHHAGRIAKMAEKAGANALLVFPSQVFMLGGQMRPEMVLAHYRTIAEATDLPIILFEYPMNTGMGFPFETILKLCEEIPSIAAMKDWCHDPLLHEKHTRTLQSLSRPINMLTTHSSWLMSSLVMGAKGLLSGAGSVIADMQVALFNAVQAEDLSLAEKINNDMYPIAQALYATPFVDMHNRMKECLAILGRCDKAVVRPPLMKLTKSEIDGLRRALAAAHVQPEGWRPTD